MNLPFLGDSWPLYYYGTLILSNFPYFFLLVFSLKLKPFKTLRNLSSHVMNAAYLLMGAALQWSVDASIWGDPRKTSEKNSKSLPGVRRPAGQPGTLCVTPVPSLSPHTGHLGWPPPHLP